MKEYIDPNDLLHFIESKLRDRKLRMEAIDKSGEKGQNAEYTYMDGGVNELLAVKRWVEQNTIKLR